MAKFVFKIPDIQDAVPAIQKASKGIKENNKSVDSTYSHLFADGFEGEGAQAVESNQKIWSEQMLAFNTLLDELYGVIHGDILPQAKQANSEAQGLVGCFGGGLFGGGHFSVGGLGGSDVVTLEPSAKQSAIASSQNIIDAYDEALVSLSEIERGLSELHNPFTPSPSISKISSEIQANTEKFVSFNSALDTYEATVQSLEAMASARLSSFTYPEGWNEKSLHVFLDTTGFQELLDATIEQTEAMKQEGILSLVCGALAAVASVAIIIGSWGTATPLVMAALLGSTAYGLSNATEGINKIILASDGQINQKAFNPIRDTLFMGNDTVYHLTGTALSLGAPYAGGAQMAINSANRALSSSVQAVNMYTVKYMASLTAGMGGSYISKNTALSLGADQYAAEWISLGFGALTGGATAAGMQKLDTTYNLSGYYNPTAPTKTNSKPVSQVENNSGIKLNKLKPNEINNMSLDELKNNLPDNWEIFENNGRVHIKDSNNNFRVRIDPPDNTTNYQHMHIYDDIGNPLDNLGNIVDRKSPDGHLLWNDK